MEWNQSGYIVSGQLSVVSGRLSGRGRATALVFPAPIAPRPCLCTQRGVERACGSCAGARGAGGAFAGARGENCAAMGTWLMARRVCRSRGLFLRSPDRLRSGREPGSRKDMHCAGASDMPLRAIRCDGSRPERIAGSELISAAWNGTGNAAQPGNGRSGHSPPRRKLLRRRRKERSTADARMRWALAAMHVHALRPAQRPRYRVHQHATWPGSDCAPSLVGMPWAKLYNRVPHMTSAAWLSASRWSKRPVE
jgi:hypothetical protein